jgi:type II secretory pathway component PulF
MGGFYYIAKKDPVETVRGVIEAGTSEEALRLVTALGYVPLEIRPARAGETVQVRRSAVSSGRPAFVWGRKISQRQLCEFLRQIYDLIDAGVTVVGAVELVERGTSHPEFRKILSGIRQRLFSGESLSAALAAYPQAFPAIYVPMLRSGEAAGRLPEVLSSMQSMTEKDVVLQEKIQASLLYPLMVLLVGVLTVFVMLTVLMPRLVVLFEDFDTALPMATQLVIGMSRFMADFWWLVLAVGVVVVLAGKRYFSQGTGRLLWDTALLRVPVLSDLVRRGETVRVARALGMLVEGGVPLPLALATALDMVSNTVLRQELADVLREVKSGISFAGALGNKPSLWPEAAVSMVAVGEATGSLSKGMFKLASSLERELEATAGVFTTVLGPLVLLLVVGVVGAMIAAMLLPLFQMNMMIQ